MQTGSADYFTGLPVKLTDLAIDYARAKLIDVERPTDDRNIPDRVDARTGTQAVPAVVPWGLILAGAAVLVLGVVVVKRVL